MCLRSLQFLVFLLVHCLAVAQSQPRVSEAALSAKGVVVLITTFDAQGQPVATGSGFVVSKDGLIATNLHVLKKASSAQVKLPSGDIFDQIQVVDADARRDLVVLKIKAISLQAASLGDSDGVRVGQHVVAIGNPTGLEHTVSDGIVSAFRQFEGYKLIQVTAPISAGSSGGPIVDDQGVVQALAVGTFEGQNLNVAIPVNYLRAMLQNIDLSSAIPLNHFLATTTSADAKTATVPPPSDKAKRPAEGESRQTMSIEGSWAATITDSKGSGNLVFNLVQNSQGDVVGTYTSSLGGGGTIQGRVVDGVFSFELTQTIQDCPGIFKGKLSIGGESGSGSYTGSDCLGDRADGRVTINRHNPTAQPSSSIPTSKPASPQAAPTIVPGTPSELRGVLRIWVSSDQHLPARNEIMRLLRARGLETVTEPRTADVGFIFSMTYEPQGNLMMADFVAQLLKRGQDSTLRQIWEYRNRKIKKEIDEIEIAKEVVDRFWRDWRRENRR